MIIKIIIKKFERLVKKRFDEIKKSSYEIKHDDSTYSFKVGTF